MTALVDQLHEAHVPPVFCFMFDEFWYALLRLNRAVELLLGTDFRRLSNMWAWRVESGSERGCCGMERDWSTHHGRNGSSTEGIDGECPPL